MSIKDYHEKHTDSHTLMKQYVLEALCEVIDPEVSENIVDLRLVYNVKVKDNTEKIDLTMTTPACLMGEMLLDDIKANLNQRLPPELNILFP